MMEDDRVPDVVIRLGKFRTRYHIHPYYYREDSNTLHSPYLIKDLTDTHPRMVIARFYNFSGLPVNFFYPFLGAVSEFVVEAGLLRYVDPTVSNIAEKLNQEFVRVLKFHLESDT